MVESIFENNLSIALKKSLAEDSIRIELDYTKEYREYKNNVLVKSIALDDDDLLLILLENRLLDLKQKGFFCVSPSCKPSCSIVPSAEKIAELETDDDLDYLIGDTNEIYLKIYEMDMVSLHDVYARLCEESGVPELQLPTEKLNCIHLGKLRRFFYQPDAAKLVSLVIDCGFDWLSEILYLLNDADALNLPISFNLICECDANHQDFKETALLNQLNIQRLTCRFNEHLPLFFQILPGLTSLNLWNQTFETHNCFHQRDAGSTLNYLKSIDLPKLRSLYFSAVSSEEELDQLLNLPCMAHLEVLQVTGTYYASSDLPIDRFLQESNIPKWQHLRQLLIDGRCVYEDTRKLFVGYPQIVFY